MRRRVSSNYRASEDEVGVRILGFVRVRPMFESERQVEDRMIVQLRMTRTSSDSPTQSVPACTRKSTNSMGELYH